MRRDQNIGTPTPKRAVVVKRGSRSEHELVGHDAELRNALGALTDGQKSVDPLGSEDRHTPPMPIPIPAPETFDPYRFQVRTAPPGFLSAARTVERESTPEEPPVDKRDLPGEKTLPPKRRKAAGTLAAPANLSNEAGSRSVEPVSGDPRAFIVEAFASVRARFEALERKKRIAVGLFLIVLFGAAIGFIGIFATGSGTRFPADTASTTPVATSIDEAPSPASPPAPATAASPTATQIAAPAPVAIPAKAEPETEAATAPRTEARERSVAQASVAAGARRHAAIGDGEPSPKPKSDSANKTHHAPARTADAPSPAGSPEPPIY